MQPLRKPVLPRVSQPETTLVATTAGTFAAPRTPHAPGFHERLARLSRRETRAGRRMAMWLPTVGALMLLILGGLALLVWWLMDIAGLFGPGTVFTTNTDPIAFFLPLFVTLNVLATLPRCVWLIARGGTLFDQQYARTWRLLESTDLAVLLADEMYWELLQRNLSLPLRRRVGSELKRRMIERQLETAAAFRMALEDLQRGTRELRRVSLARGIRTLGQVQTARLMWLIVAMPVVFMFAPLLMWLGPKPSNNYFTQWPGLPLIGMPLIFTLMMVVSINAHNGPPLVQYRATLAALADYLLRDDSRESPRADLPASLPTSRWWARVSDWWLGVEERIRRMVQGPLI